MDMPSASEGGELSANRGTGGLEGVMLLGRERRERNRMSDVMEHTLMRKSKGCNALEPYRFSERFICKA